jgi:hypothetical protein
MAKKIRKCERGVAWGKERGHRYLISGVFVPWVTGNRELRKLSAGKDAKKSKI